MSLSASPSIDQPTPVASSVWRWVLLLFPIVVGVGLLVLRQIEVSSLARRPLPHLGNVGQFSLTNQDNQKFGSADLAGKVWIADFVFTNCHGPCPIISSRSVTGERIFASSAYCG